MKGTKKNILTLLIFALLGIGFILSVSNKEKTLKEGQFVLLELAPVDPRSLMQGDYMELNYALTANSGRFRNSIIDTIASIDESEESAKRGYLLLTVNEEGVGTTFKMTSSIGEKGPNEVYLKYFNNNGRTFNIGAESFFFQEGEASKFEEAKYGGLKVDEQGNSILIGMYDENLERIE